MGGIVPRWLLAMVGVTTSSVALAGSCPAPYTSDQLLSDLPTIEGELRHGDDAGANKAAKAMQDNLGCLHEVLPAMILGRTFRAIAGGLYVGGDVNGAQDWFATALLVDPTFEYGVEDLPSDHPLISVYDSTRRAGSDAPAAVDKPLAAGTHYVDGKKISKAQAVPNQPHLYQWDSNGVRSWVIVGNAFPPEAFSAAPEVATVTPPPAEKKPAKPPPAPKPAPAAKPPPAEKAPPPAKPAEKPVAEKEEEAPPPVAKPVAVPKTTTTTGNVAVLTRQRPPEKTPLMIAGGALIVGSGAVYYASSVARGKFDDAATKDDIDQYKTATNRLVVASAAVLAVGAGTLTWGVILEGSTPIPSLHVRF